MKATVRDRILLLLSIKEPGAKIDFQHIFEKVSRDVRLTITEPDLQNELEQMAKQGLVRVSEGVYYITDGGMELIKKLLPEIGEDLNLSYRMVLIAKDYYEKVADHLLPFLRERPVSIIKIFSDDADPIRKIKPLFVRYAKYKPKPVFIKIDSKESLMRYVDDHALDYVPYVHSFDMKEPSWLVLDLDAGEGLRSMDEGFLAVKFVAGELMRLLGENEVQSAVKFSGSRGMQVWASLDNTRLPKGDLFAIYRHLIQRLQAMVEEQIKGSQPPPALKHLVEKGLTTSSVAKKGERPDKVLIDWSSMKPYGDVRAPFSMHYKTSLISCPVDPSRILKFEPNEAKPELVATNAEQLSLHFQLTKSDPSSLLKTLGL
jgi:DNA primase